MNTKIYLIRHAQTYGNTEKRLAGRTEFDVTEDGYKQIEKLTNRLKDIKFDKAYSSTSLRSYETIKKIAQLNDLEIEKTENLCEMDFGIYDGWKWEDVNEINPSIKKTQDEINEIAGIPEQESTQEVANRMYNYIRAVAIDNKGKVVLMASHGVAIEAFIRKVKHEKFSENIKENSQKNTAINIVEYDTKKDIFEILKLNDISHLEEN